MIYLYKTSKPNKRGKRKLVAKFKSWINAAKWVDKHQANLKAPEFYFYKHPKQRKK